MSIAVLRQMFEQMVENKDPTAIDRFYHPSFVMFSNGVTQDFEAFAASHRTIYATPISYSVEYDEQAWVEATDKVAGRVWITTSRPGENPTRIEVVLIAEFVDTERTMRTCVFSVPRQRRGCPLQLWQRSRRSGVPRPRDVPSADGGGHQT